MGLRGFLRRSPRSAFAFCLGAIIALSGSRVLAAEDFSTWAHSAKIKINTTTTGANVPSTYKQFPLLVRITDTRILTQSMATGADIRFMDEKGEVLQFQVERWTPAAGKAEFWVRIPQLEGNNEKQFLTIYWGKPGSPWLSDGAAVFRQDAGFNIVYHLGEASTQARTNSVGNWNHAAPKDYEGDERVQGIIGMADSLDGAAKAPDYLDLGAGFKDLKAFSFNMWANLGASGLWERFMELGNGPYRDNLVFSREDTLANFAALMFADSAGTPPEMPKSELIGWASAKGGLENKKWTFVGLVISGKTMTVFKNGAKAGIATLAREPTVINRASNFIGRSNFAEDSYYVGLVDEPQFSTEARGDDWMKLTYESQRPDSKLLAWEFPADVKLAFTAQPAGVTVAEGKAVKLGVKAVSSYPISYQWFKDGAILASAKTDTLAILAASLGDAGAYTCRAIDGKDTITSKAAYLDVPEVLATWGHSQKVFINTTVTGAGLDSDVVNIPVLLRLGKKSLDFSQASAGGKDLRFTDSEGAGLAHAVESWGTDTADVWVRLPKVTANTDKRWFNMYWGKASARNGSSPGYVFSINDNWRGYYGFNEIPVPGGTVTASDATLNGYKGTGTGVAAAAGGAIGKAMAFGGGSAHVELPVAASGGLKAYTLLLWAREKTTGHGSNAYAHPALAGTRAEKAGQGDFGIVSDFGLAHAWNTHYLDETGVTLESNTMLNDGKWHSLAITYTGSAFILYGDGASVSSKVADNKPLASASLGIGAMHNPDGGFLYGFTGDIDAVQLTGDAKSGNWLKLAHAVQTPGSTVVTFGAPADLPPPAPAIDPPAGDYDAPVTVQITCAADSVRILYTLDGSEPDTVARGSTRNIGSNIRLTQNGTVKALAYRNGKASAVTAAAYRIVDPATAAGDTLKPGTSKEVDAGHRVTFPNQDSKSPVRLAAGPAWNPLPKGFDRVGPLFTLAAVDPSAAFPGLLVEGDSLPGLSLFRRDPNLVILWMPPKDGQLWIPSAGTYFWGRDTLPPRIRLAGTSARGDSLTARIVIDDNVAGVQGKVRFWNGGQDSLGWWSVPAGEILEFTVPAPANPETPLEVRFSATDQSRTTQFPETRKITMPRALPALAAPLDLKPGIHWKMAGMPLIAEGSVSLGDLARMSGTGPLYAAIWRRGPAPDTGYLILKGEDTLPSGKGFWLAAEQAAPSLNFPASRAVASDSDGLFALRLQKGWNLVTCPSFRPLAWPVSTKDGDAYLRSALKPLHGLADNGYSRPDSLRPWEAYYVWYDKDTTVRIGPGAPRVADLFKAPKAAIPAKSLRLNLTGPGALLDLGASTFARPGLGREDESRPPPVDRRASAWLAREGRALAADYVAWDPDHAMAWTVASRGQSPGASFAITDATLPPGYEAWAVSPSRRLKWRLLPGGNIPVTGDDTLAVYAGTPRALAKIGDLQRGRDAAGAFAARLRAAAGGLELMLELPSNATLTLSVYDARGRRLGGIAGRDFAPGRHALSWQSLAIENPHLPQGAYFMSIHAQGPDWTRHQVQSVTLFR